MPVTDQPRRLAVYARISSDEKGYASGVKDQAGQCRDLIAQRFPGAEITGPGCRCASCVAIGTPADVYCDNDISASGKKRRPHYEQLLADIEAGRVEGVVAVHNDRLHRNDSELHRYMDACGKRDIPTFFVKSGDLDLSNATGRMVAKVVGAMATAELERTQERITAAKRRNRDTGLRSGANPPFGFALDERDMRGRQIPGVSRGLVVVPDEADVMRRAYKQVLAGVSMNAIAAQLNREGFKTHRQARGAASAGNGTWKSTTVRHMLLRAANAALIEYPATPPGRGEIVGNAQWEPVIDEDTYRAARALLTDPSRRTTPGREPAHLLTGVLVCGVCDCTYFAVRTIRNTRLYQCNAYWKYPGQGITRHLSRKANDLDKYVEAVIIERLRQPDVLQAMTRKPEVDLDALLAERNALQARLDEFARMAGDGEITGRDFATISRQLQPRVEEADKKLTAAITVPGLDEFTVGGDPAEIWAALPLERKRAVARLLLRVRLLPIGKGQVVGRKGVPRGTPYPLDLTRVEILPPDA